MAGAKLAAEKEANSSAAVAATKAGPYHTRAELKAKLQSHALTSSISQNLQGPSSGFDLVLQLSGLDNMGPGADDWKILEKEDLYILERRIQDIIDGIEGTEVPEDMKDPEGPQRLLIEDWNVLPYELIPDYDMWVRRLICFEGMKEKLSRHGYSSMSEFSRDFFTLLNNGRSVSNQATDSWNDASLLATIFDELKAKSLETNASDIKQLHTKDLRVLDKGKRSQLDSAVNKVCACCVQEYTLEGWPTNPKADANKAAKWLCPDCIRAQASDLLGNRVSVWWDEDSKYYKGTINAFDAASGRHRVLYDDNEWEFACLGHEIAVFPDWKKMK